MFSRNFLLPPSRTYININKKFKKVNPPTIKKNYGLPNPLGDSPWNSWKFPETKNILRIPRGIPKGSITGSIMEFLSEKSPQVAKPNKVMLCPSGTPQDIFEEPPTRECFMRIGIILSVGNLRKRRVFFCVPKISMKA